MITKVLLPEADLLRVRANHHLDPKRKSALGQFFTPAPICQYMASLFTSMDGEISLLDPGCGVGSLSVAFVDEALRRGKTDKLQITAYDVEPSVAPYITHELRQCEGVAASQRVRLSSTFLQEDFILNTAAVLSQSLFFPEPEQYTHVILNPPYKKIANKGEHHQALQRVGIDTVNLYTGFISLAIKLLKPNGELVAIVPRSFCNGLYYQSFREFLLSEVALNHIHIFDSRNQAFADGDVLQENIIIACKKHGLKGEVTITSSPGSDFSLHVPSGQVLATDMTIRKVGLDQIVKVGDLQKFIHIAPSQYEQSIVDSLACFTSTLGDLGIEVSTGPVVDFRLKADLRNDLEEGAVPLLYPTHFDGKNLNSGVHWPKRSKKPNAIYVSEHSQPWLWSHEGSFVVVRRFSSKEELHRIVATPYHSSLPGKFVGFDNKLNVFHCNKIGFDEALAKGLSIYLSSSLLDKYYRQFGGHTQVNATDLRNIHYPSSESLRNIGKAASQFPLSQQEIDTLIRQEIEKMTRQPAANPLDAKTKLEQALEILKQLGMPRAQQNDRSALTLLALLNLRPDGSWQQLERPMLGVSSIMDWCRQVYGKEYAPNTRETFRRQTLHQFQEAGLVIYNPDSPDRPVNSPKACYQISVEVQRLLAAYGTEDWEARLENFLRDRPTLVQKYAKSRTMSFVSLQIAEGQELSLTPGIHNELIREIVMEFGPRFAPGAEVIYVGDTGDKAGYFLQERLEELGVTVDRHGKLPDVVLFDAQRNWLLLVESVTSHGPVNSKRHGELASLFVRAKPELVFVTAFPDRRTMGKYLADISWETEVWIADSPTHMIHFNGDKFLGPH
jgi:adenine-specific DNA-methyltransferase